MKVIVTVGALSLSVIVIVESSKLISVIPYNGTLDTILLFPSSEYITPLSLSVKSKLCFFIPSPYFDWGKLTICNEPLSLLSVAILAKLSIEPNIVNGFAFWL